MIRFNSRRVRRVLMLIPLPGSRGTIGWSHVRLGTARACLYNNSFLISHEMDEFENTDSSPSSHFAVKLWLKLPINAWSTWITQIFNSAKTASRKNWRRKVTRYAWRASWYRIKVYALNTIKLKYIYPPMLIVIYYLTLLLLWNIWLTCLTFVFYLRYVLNYFISLLFAVN